MRLDASNVSSFLSRSMAWSEALGKSFSKGYIVYIMYIYNETLPARLGNYLANFLYFSRGIILSSCSEGVPMISKMSSIWFLVSQPGRKGFLRKSSANMHPTDHMSTAHP